MPMVVFCGYRIPEKAPFSRNAKGNGARATWSATRHARRMRRGDPECALWFINGVLLMCHVHTHGLERHVHHPLFSTDSLQHNHARPLFTRGIPETPRMPNAAPHVCACGGRPLVQTYMRCTDRTLRAMGIPIALGRSPFSWTCGRGRFGGRRPGGRECSAPPRTTQNACLPLSSRMHPLPHLLSTVRAAGNAAHAERGPTCMCVRRAPSHARPCVAPPGSACSRRLCPAVRWRDRAHAAARGNPDESVAADASGASHGARQAHARESCGACWSSAQRAPEPAYARVT